MSGRRLGDLFNVFRRRVAQTTSAASATAGSPNAASASPAAPPSGASASARWERVQDLLIAAIELPSGARGAYLDRECAGDAALRQEVTAMLAAHETPGILDHAPGNVTATVPAPFPSTGVVSHYRVLEKLGVGGMGVVYRARDERLGRTVALKFLHPFLVDDEQAKERFRVEAQAAAALDHPNICTIHEIGETADGQLFIAMPFYEGTTLKARCAEGALPPPEAISVAVQAAHGLAQAHDRGIVHRDIKPANLMLTADGVLKILDFGVAKRTDVALTRPGMAPGTIAYMSPEQALGEPVDGRSDIWSLGVVLFEMLAGERPFRGDHEQALMHAIVRLDPAPLHTRHPGVSRELERIVRRALARRREDRYGSAREFAQDLESARADGLSTRTARAAPAGAVPVEGERRRIAVAVATVAGHADLIERLAPREADDVLRHIETEARAVADRHEGVLNRCSADALVLLFGVPVAHEDDPLRAVRAAVELHQRIEQLSERFASRDRQVLRLQIGLDAGASIVRPAGGPLEEFRLAGAPAQAAAILAAHAAPGTTWISAECERLIRPYFESAPRAPVAIPGRTDAAPAFEVARPTGFQSRLEAAERGGLTAYAGRDGELAALRGFFDAASHGAGRCVIVAGEAGLGKSRLLHEFRQEVDRDGVTLLQGRCQAYGGGTAYLPFVEVLRGMLRLEQVHAPEAEPDAVVQAIRGIGAELEEFIPFYLHLLSLTSERHPMPRHLQGEQFRLAMQEALAALITIAAVRRPAVILLEDWHWADDASDSVLRQMAELLSAHSVLVVVTCRPDHLPEWGDLGRLTALELRPLDQSASLAVARAVLRVDRVPDELGARLHERTGGNPFFLEEICHALLEEGVIRVSGREVMLTGAAESLQLPDTVQAVIRTRLDRLDQDARGVLRLASVVGREFTRSLLEHSLAGGGRLSNALQTLKTTGLIQQIQIVPEPAYRFKHVLTQEVAYASLLEHQRKELHGRVGVAIEQLPRERMREHLDRLAHHFGRAEEWDKAVRYGIQSAERAAALSQFAEALEMLERAEAWLARLPDDPERRRTLCEILLRQERMCETLGLRGRQQRIVDQLVALLSPGGDPAALAEVYLRRGDVCTLLRRFDEAEEALQASLRMRRELGDTIGQRNTLRSLGLLRWHAGRSEEALPYMNEALAIDRADGNLEATVGDLSNLGPVLKGLGRYSEARRALEEALALVESAGRSDSGASADTGDLPLKQSYILQNLANIHRELGDPALALKYLERAAALAVAKRLPIQLSYHYTAVAHLTLQNGAIDDAVRYYQDAVELTRKARYAPGLSQSLRFLGEVELSLGRRAAALPHLEEAAILFAQLQDRDGEGAMWTRIAEIHERADRIPDAVGAWSRALALRRDAGDRAGALIALEGLARSTRRHATESSLALVHYREAAQLAHELGDGPVEGRVRNTIGILEWERGAHEGALAEYERALALFEALGDVPSHGLMLNSIGVTLKALGRRAEARRRLEAAVLRHRATGQRLLEGHALAALGDIHLESAEAAEAEDCYARSLEIRRELGDRGGQGWMLAQLARVELARGFTDRARTLAAEAAAIAVECGDLALRERCARFRL
ncbi:MAG TPA: tetratricopeptide repeat protein [Gemmatimonadales bacterium]|nr:tetratricopeptide repeat protein [Gemmatimonadales bacterium]